MKKLASLLTDLRPRMVLKAASLDYAFLDGLYLLLMSKILFQMPKRQCTFTNDIQEKHPCFRKGRNDYEAECLVCKLLVCCIANVVAHRLYLVS